MSNRNQKAARSPTHECCKPALGLGDRHIRRLDDGLWVLREDALLAVAPPTRGQFPGGDGDAHGGWFPREALHSDRVVVLPDEAVPRGSQAVGRPPGVLRGVRVIPIAREAAGGAQHGLEQRSEGGQAGGDDADVDFDVIPDVVGVVPLGVDGGQGVQLVVELDDRGRAGEDSEAQNSEEGDLRLGVQLEPPNDRDGDDDEGNVGEDIDGGIHEPNRGEGVEAETFRGRKQTWVPVCGGWHTREDQGGDATDGEGGQECWMRGSARHPVCF